MKLEELIKERITGEWGIEPNGEDTVKVIRTTNFQNDGQLNLNEVVKRKIDRKIIDKKKLRPNDIIIEKSGGSPNQPVGRVVYFENSTEEYLCNNFTTILRPTKEVIPKYLFYNLYYNHIVGKTQRYQNKTTGILNLQLERYLQEEIFIPDETKQKNIVKALDKSFSLIQKRKETIKLADEFLRSTFLEMFGDPVKNDRNWNTENCENVFEMKLGKMLSAKNYTGKNLKPYLRNVNVQWGKIVVDDVKEMDFEDLEFEIYKLRKGDILVCEGGEVGKTAIYNDELFECGYQNALHRLRIKSDEIITKEFFLYFMIIGVQRGLIKKFTSSVTIQHFTLEKFKELQVIIPPIELQRKFSTFVVKINSIKEKYQTSLTEMENQFNSLMQRAFRGEL